jgi:para-aminobenzoate synthetase/4-amino-4-deoxychorismate lyase
VLFHGGAPGAWVAFTSPRRVVAAWKTADVIPALEEIERRAALEKLHAAGFIAYEAAPAFDPALPAFSPSSLPLLWFGLYTSPEPFLLPDIQGVPSPVPRDWTPTVTREEYRNAIAAIKDHIVRGDTYQVNYTFRLRAPFDQDPLGLFACLMRAQETRHAAFLDIGSHAVASVSPELFFELENGLLSSRPMKGTAKRGLTLEEDRERAEWLASSEKNRAENVMIVDMIRNDMGRVAEAGTVRVPRLFEVERYPTVWQMTSLVEARTQKSPADIFRALFPCASITGAPKRRTMEIIRELETTPRGIYCGAIGHIRPDGGMRFNVAIRTVVVDKAARQAEYGVGGGVLWYSETEDEYEECMTKARVLGTGRPVFSLLETLLWEPGKGYALMEEHLERLSGSAEVFGFAPAAENARAELLALAATLPACPHKVRLLADSRGGVSLSATPMEGRQNGPVRLALAKIPVDPSDMFLYHKTTHRAVYEAARAGAEGADDVLLVNTRGELTETAIRNVALELDGVLCTPPASCGLLAGTYRGRMLAEGRILERVLTVGDLGRAARIVVMNSVRGMEDAVLVAPSG